MTDWLAPVAATLETVAAPCPFFFRDDDAGWDDGALFAVLDEFEAAGVAVDVAAIPIALTRSSASRLAAYCDGGVVRVHQHGYAHANHELHGRKCEFGGSRSPAEQAVDVRLGRARLEDLLGGAIDPVFTPPWNRCSPATADAAVAAGHHVLSRDHSAGCLDLDGLVEIPVTNDWSAHRKGVPETAAERGRKIAEQVAAGGPVGVMLHHAVLDAADRLEVRRLLDLVATSPGAEATTILRLALPTARQICS